ncbi:chromatin assembly factor 1 subunit FAS1 isoform X4 [Cornus florida]|uniref:chromatin assembly factor 1 subunit FAS1 isoform X4 n=1 Tax=Cornus florida TaxID=4283 RepID=UPI0028A21425|nr:chromatin assembly factor 1 subunit FAS1 isoform X4 [Cornus florida]
MADSKKPEMNSPNQDNSAKRSLKRKRASLIDSLSTQEKANRIDALREELNGLFKYYKEVLDKKVKFDLGNCGSSNSVIACMIEESNLPFSKLVDEIFEKMKVNERESSSSVTTLASVKSSVLFVGQRCSYGLTNPDADVLEDQSESCLWCWETRDLKLMPKIMKSAVKIRRTCRKKIHERLTAVSAMITALEKSQSSHNYSLALTKASEKLAKVLSEADIRLLAESMEQKNGADMAEKEVKQEEKLLIKQLEKNKREVEKGKKRMDLEQQKEKWQSEKELKRLQDEAEKEEKRREKEESEMRKHLRRQQEEVEKDLRRREKEEAELKKQLALQKQASIMERFLKRSKNNSTSQNGQSSSKATTSNPSPNRSENMPESITMSMDYALALKNEINTEDIHNQVVGPRHPFEKDAELDYDIDSDEEWEEEEPGENLSDCEMDDDKESLEEGCSKADDEDESEDGFFVPDGYLSENEGVQVDRMESDRLVEEARSSQSCKQELESEEFCMLLRQQKHLRKLTEHALRKNQPLIILNLMHEKAPSSTAEDLTGSLKLEQTCLQALGMRAFPGGSFIEISPGSNVLEEDQEACPSSCKVSTTPVATATAIMVSDLPQIVSAIQSCSQGINKVVESLQHKFPTIPKSQLRNKVREISDFVDNRWQVKKDILDKLGLSNSPGKGGGRTKSIATFFSKRCLPPAGKTINPIETSPQTPATAVQLQQGCMNTKQ